jgi:hypothetical protein
MLKDGDQAARPGNPMELSQPHRVFVVGDVVEHAGRKHNVEGIRLGRDAILFDEKIIVRFRITPFAERQAAFGDVR